MSNDKNVGTKAHWDASGFWAGLSRVVEVRGWTWRRVSVATGVSQSTLSRMKNGRKPDAASLAALSNWSGLSPAQFFPVTPSEPSPIRFGADACASAIREMVKADIDGDGARYTVHETAMRQQLHALEAALPKASA